MALLTSSTAWTGPVNGNMARIATNVSGAMGIAGIFGRISNTGGTSRSRDTAPQYAMNTPPHGPDAFPQELLAGPGAIVVFEHRGEVDHSVVERLLAMAESASLAANDAVSLRKRLFNVLVEGLENIHHHVEETSRASAFAMLTDTPKGYRLVLGNNMPVAMGALLGHRVGILNEMDDADLKEHYLKLLANEGRTERGGAGLGLLTMARKSSRPILAHIRPDRDGTVFFALELTVSRS